MRHITDELKLPNSEIDLSISPNINSGKSIFDEKINKIQENFNYLKSLGTIAVPVSEQNKKNIYSDLFLKLNSSDKSITSLHMDYSINDVYNDNYHLMAHNTYNISNIEYNILCILNKDTQTIDIYKSEKYNKVDNELKYSSNYTFITSYSKIKENGNLFFVDITGISLTNDGYLFVVDSGLELILKYDINAIIADTPQIKNKQILKIIYNGNIQNDTQNTFTPKFLKLYQNNIYVYNAKNNNIIKYDLNLKFVNSFYCGETPNKLVLTDIAIDCEYFYLLYDNGFCEKYTFDEKLANFVKFSSRYKGSIFKKIEVSEKNNLLLISTNRSVFQKDKSKFKNNINYDYSFVEEEMNNILLYYDIINSNENLYILSHRGINIIPITLFTYDLYDKNIDDNLFTINLVDDNELEQDFVYNERIQKIIYNHIMYYNSIIKIPLMGYNLNGDGILNGFVIPKKEKINIKSNYIGISEVFGSVIFNREIKNIYKLQEKILDTLKTKKIESNPHTLVIS